MFILSANLVRTVAYVNGNNYIEMITNKKLTISNSLPFTPANVQTNCFVRNNLGAVVTGVMQNCFYEIKNKGQTLREYTRLRIGGSANGFWSSGNNFYWGFNNANLE
jgi:hypothetical protein